MDYTQAENRAIQNIGKWISDFGFFPGSVGPNTARHLYRMVRETKPDLVFEIGCYLGYSTLHIAKGLKENNRGRLVSFDLMTCWASATIQEAGLSDYAEFVQGHSDIMASQHMTGLGNEAIDILFIDGDHTRRGCVRDFNALQESVRDGGYVIFHDIYPEMCGWKGPRMVIDALDAVKSEPCFVRFDIEERRDLDPFGVAICRMRARGKNPLKESKDLKQLDIYIKTSRLMKLSELISFEAKLPLPHRNFMQGMKNIFKGIYGTYILPKFKGIKVTPLL